MGLCLCTAQKGPGSFCGPRPPWSDFQRVVVVATKSVSKITKYFYLYCHPTLTSVSGPQTSRLFSATRNPNATACLVLLSSIMSCFKMSPFFPNFTFSQCSNCLLGIRKYSSKYSTLKVGEWVIGLNFPEGVFIFFKKWKIYLLQQRGWTWRTLC